MGRRDGPPRRGDFPIAAQDSCYQDTGTSAQQGLVGIAWSPAILEDQLVRNVYGSIAIQIAAINL